LCNDPGVSTLSSSSTLTEVNAAYADNASYFEDASATKARAFTTACRILISKLATEQAVGAERVRLDENIRQLREEIKAAEAYANANSTNAANRGSVRQIGTRNLREC